MYKTLFVRHFYSLIVAVCLCSFAYFETEENIDLEQNELSYSDTKIELNFGGLEELVSPVGENCFRTDIYLSDVDLNNATLNVHEQIVMVLKNHMDASEFQNGKLAAKQSIECGETGVSAQLYTLNGVPTDVEVVSGSVEYSGEYPQVALEFDFLLSNGEKLRGSYSKELKSFKYYF